MSLILDAARFAAQCHEGQTRKYNGQPYITHPIRVAGRTATHPMATEELVAAAFLHDVIEDCGQSEDEIALRFGALVTGFVVELTNTSKEHGVNRAERKRRDRDRMAKVSTQAKIVKLIDRIDNLREIDRGNDFFSVYAAESLLLADVLDVADAALADELRSLCRDL
jgi:(p)ppGpp synthase/HD superfamily hydrolase